MSVKTSTVATKKKKKSSSTKVNKKVTNKSNKVYSKEDKMKILDKLGKVDISTKKKVRQDSKYGRVLTNEEDYQKNNESGKNSQQTILQYEIDPNDNIFVRTLIGIINERKITTQWLYNRIYKIYNDEMETYEKARSTGYNFLYALTVKKELGIPRLLQWFEILGVEDFDISYSLKEMDTEGNIEE